MEFYLITWKQFEKRKLLDKQEIIKTEKYEEGLERIKSMNAQKRLTTTDYRAINLTKLFKNNGLSVSDDIHQ